MKSKKGALPLTLEQLTKLILLSIIIILVFIPLGTKLYGFYFPSIDKELKKSLNQLVTEAEDLKNDIEKHGITNSSINIPTYLKGDTKFRAYESDSDEKKCKKKPCFCIFQEKDDRELSACKILKGVMVGNALTIESTSTGIMNINMAAEKVNNKIIIQIT